MELTGINQAIAVFIMTYIFMYFYIEATRMYILKKTDYFISTILYDCLFPRTIVAGAVSVSYLLWVN